MGVMRSALLWVSRNDWMRETLPRYRFMRRAVNRFMPGEQAEDALDAAGLLKANGFSTVFTRLGENVRNEAEADEVTKHYCALADDIAARRLDGHISVKLTQLGHDLDQNLSFRNLRLIIAQAEKHKNFVWIDMEGSAYTESTIKLFERIRSECSNVGLCLQSYLHRCLEDIRRLSPLNPAIRLVKGAYAEPASIAYQKKSDVDENFVRCSLEMLNWGKQHGIVPVFGTHDTRLIDKIRQEAGKVGLSKGALEFHLLYGIKRDEQSRLVREGYRVRVLISYGSYWFPWYMRRLAERPANVAFVLKNLFG